jgi:tRNA(Ile)-lysidine synthase
MSDTRDVRDRFDRALAELMGDSAGERVVVAFSGGLDSCALLHLLRFRLAPGPEIVVAHLDHGMRAESAADAQWVRGLCSAWGLSVTTSRVETAPASEGAARRVRYDFLERVREEVGARWLLTAHHADDQAETVLFRVLRGTGIEGLAGIPATREPGIIRPLLGFWREELESYNSSVGLSWRDDASNQEPGFARNAIRRSLLPLAEDRVASGARSSLVRLARLARENEAAWSAVMPDLLGPLDVSWEGEGGLTLSWDRAAADALPRPLRGRVLRHLSTLVGTALDEGGTRLGVEFITASRSGSGIDLGGGIELRRELDRLFLVASRATGLDVPLQIRDPGSGEGEAVLGGRPVSVSWGAQWGDQWGDQDGSSGDEGVFPVEELEFPLLVRGRVSGDRIRLSGGSRKLKKLLLEARIPSGRRDQTPVLVDDGGRVLWVPGIARAVDLGDQDRGGDEGRFRIRIG